jgi:nitroreductase
VKSKDVDLEHASKPEVITAIRDRQSVRAFIEKDVPKELLTKILDTARFAPSGVNTQPWQVAVLGPKHRQVISQAIIEARDKQIPENPDYHYYPDEWFEPYKSRRKACGLALYSALDIQINETEKRKKQWYRNYSFFDAPLALIFYLDGRLCKGSWMDMGMFIQNVMICARAVGLETCPQAALAEYPNIIRKHLNIPDSMHIVCGMAMGYADWSHPINQYRTTREDVESFTVFHD